MPKHFRFGLLFLPISAHLIIAGSIFGQFRDNDKLNLRERSREFSLNSKDNLSIKNPPQLANSIGNNNLQNMPFQFGLEYINKVITENENKDLIYGYMGFVNVNLYEKVLFLRLEIGKCYVYDYTNYSSAFGSLGFIYNMKLSKHNRLMIDLSFIGYKGLFLPRPSMSVKYMYAFNNFYGITIGTKLIAFSKPYLTAGVQFFTN